MQLPPPARRSQPVSRPVQGATVKPKTPKTVNKTVDPKTTTTATPKGSVSASGWLSWPKLCWQNGLCTIYFCLIAASGGVLAYFLHGSDGLLPFNVVPASAAPLCTPDDDLDYDDDGVFRLGDAVFLSNVWTGEETWKKAPPCNGGDNDGDGVFRLADAVKTAELWSTSLNRRRRATANEWSGDIPGRARPPRATASPKNSRRYVAPATRAS